MGRTKKVGSTGRFGSRYGAKLRRRVLDIDKRRAEPHRCPSCATKGSLKRVAVGLWSCRKCDLSFAGGAYVPYTDAGRAAKRAIDQRTSDEILTLRDDTEEVPEFMTPLSTEIDLEVPEIEEEPIPIEKTEDEAFLEDLLESDDDSE